MSPRVVGGVFDLPELGEPDHAGLGPFISRAPGAWHLSGRSALTAILAFARSNGVRHLHVPAFLCASVLDAVHLIASIETYLRVNNEHPKPLIWTATAESILTKVQRGRVALQQVANQI